MEDPKHTHSVSLDEIVDGIRKSASQSAANMAVHDLVDQWIGFQSSKYVIELAYEIIAEAR